MYIQVQNSTKKRNNQFRAQTMSGAIKKLKSLGWKSTDCTFKQLDKALVDTKYKELDGRQNTRGKQFMQRSL